MFVSSCDWSCWRYKALSVCLCLVATGRVGATTDSLYVCV